MKGSPKHLKKKTLKKKVSDGGKEEEESKKEPILDTTKEEKGLDSYLDEVKDALEKGADVNETNGMFGLTALHRFCAEDNLEGVKFLLQQKRINVDVLDGKNRTPLLLIAQDPTVPTDKTENIVRLLLENGAKIEILDKQLIMNSFHYACFYQKVKIIEILLKHDPNIINSTATKFKKTALNLLNYSKNKDYSEIIDLLLKNNASVNDADSKGKTSLHSACGNNNVKNVTLLLEKSEKIDVNVLDNNLQTPLHYICMAEGDESDRLKIIKLLLENGAYVNIQNFDYLYTPLHYSFMKGKLKTAELLLENGAYLDLKHPSSLIPTEKLNNFAELLSLYPRNLYSSDDGSRNTTTAIHLICKQGNLNILNKLLRENLSLVRNGLDLKDEKGNTPLHLACEYNHFEIVCAILRINLNIYILNDEDNTPLHIAFLKQNDPIFLELLYHIKDNNQNLTRFLLLKNKKGDDLFRMSQKGGNSKIIRTIEEEYSNLIEKKDLLAFILNDDLDEFKKKVTEIKEKKIKEKIKDEIKTKKIEFEFEFEFNYINDPKSDIPILSRVEFLKALLPILPTFNIAKIDKDIKDEMKIEIETELENRRKEIRKEMQEDLDKKDLKKDLKKMGEEFSKQIEYTEKQNEELRRQKEDLRRQIERKKAEKELLNEIAKEEAEKIRKKKSSKAMIEKQPSSSPPPPLSPTPSPPPPRPLSPPPISSLSSVFSSVSLTKTSDDKRDREREKRVLDELHNYNDKEKEYETYSKNIEEVRSKESECKELINTFDIKRGELSSHALESTIENYNSNNFLLNLNKDITTLKKTYGDKKKELDRLIPAGENLLNRLKLNETYYVYNPKPCQYSNEKQTCGSLNLNIKIKPDKDNEIKIHGLFPDEAETDKRNGFDDYTSLRKKLYDKFYKEYRIERDTPELNEYFSNYNHLDYKRIYYNNFFNFFNTKEDFIASFMWHLKFSNQNVLLFLNNILWLSDAIIITLSKDTQVFSEKDPASLNKKVNDLLSHQLGKDFFYSDIGEDDIVVNGKVVGKEFQIKLYFHLCYNDEIEHPKWQFCKKDYKFQNINADTKASFKSSIKSRTMKPEDGKKSARRKSARRKSVRRKSVRRKSVRRKSVRRKSVRRKSVRRKSVRRKSVRRK